MDNLEKLQKGLEIATKAGEVVSTTSNSEWYESGQTATSIKEFILDNSGILSIFGGGFVGNDLPQSYKIPFNKDSYKMKKKSEWVDTASPAADGKPVSSNVVEMTQKQLIVEFDISDEFMNHSSSPQMLQYIVKMAGNAADNSIANMIVNGDTVTAATGNINSDDQAPATTFADGANDDSLLLDGARKAAISNGNTVAIGTFDSDDVLSVKAKLGKTYMSKLKDVAFVTDPYTYNTMLKDDAIKLAINTDLSATVDGGYRQTLFGSDLINNGLMPLTEADGKVSKTAGSNTKGQLLAIYKPAFFHGFGAAPKTEIVRVPGYGYRVVVTMEWSFCIADDENTVAAGIDITV